MLGIEGKPSCNDEGRNELNQGQGEKGLTNSDDSEKSPPNNNETERLSPNNNNTEKIRLPLEEECSKKYKQSAEITPPGKCSVEKDCKQTNNIHEHIGLNDCETVTRIGKESISKRKECTNVVVSLGGKVTSEKVNDNLSEADRECFENTEKCKDSTEMDEDLCFSVERFFEELGQGRTEENSRDDKASKELTNFRKEEQLGDDKKANEMNELQEECTGDESDSDEMNLTINESTEQRDSTDLTCHECKKSFDTNDELSTHMKLHHKRFECPVCDKIYSRDSHLKRHSIVHLGIKFKCKQCDKVFLQESSLVRHLKKIHMMKKPTAREVEDSKTNDSTDDKLTISQEKEELDDIQSNEKSILNETSNEGEKSNNQNCIAELSTKLSNMQKEPLADKNKCNPINEQKEQKRTVSKRFKCLLCNKDFASKGNLQRHSLTQHLKGRQEKNLGSTSDNKTSDILNDLQNKVELNDKDKEPIAIHRVGDSIGNTMNCEELSKEGNNETSIRKSCDTLSNLRGGESEDLGNKMDYNPINKVTKPKCVVDKPFKCLECSKCFLNISNLKRHAIIHLGIRHKCEKCGKEFAQSCSLIRHLKKHAEVKVDSTIGDQTSEKMANSLVEEKFADTKDGQLHEAETTIDKMNLNEINDEGKMDNQNRTEKSSDQLSNLEDKKVGPQMDTKSVNEEKCTEGKINYNEINKGGEKVNQDRTEESSDKLSTLLGDQVGPQKDDKLMNEKCTVDIMNCNEINQEGEMDNQNKTEESSNELSNVQNELVNDSKSINEENCHFDKPVKCPDCNKYFATSHHLKRHSSVHSGRRYKCDQCNKEFMQMSSLSRHLKKHAGIGLSSKIAVKSRGNVSDSLEENKLGIWEDWKEIKDEPVDMDIVFETYHEEMKIERDEDFVEESSGRSLRKRVQTSDKIDFDSIEDSIDELSQQKVAKSYTCAACKTYYDTETELFIHMKTHDKSFKCPICGKSFPTNSRLKRHITSHSVDRPFKCDECGKVFKQNSTLIHHLKRHEERRTNAVDGDSACDKSTNSEVKVIDDNEEHLSTELPDETYTDNKMDCDEVNREKENEIGRTDELSDFQEKEILVNKVNMPINELPEEKCAVDKMEIDEINKENEKYEEIKMEESDENPSNLHSEHLSAKEEYQIVEEQPSEDKMDYDEMSREGEICSSDNKNSDEKLTYFGENEYLAGTKDHMSSHGRLEEIFANDKMDCDETNKENENLLDNQGNVDGLGQQLDSEDFTCMVCEERFDTKGELITHRKIHPKPFKCRVCDKLFPTNSHLKRHSTSHSGRRPYKCEECGKDFTQSSNLLRHLKTHQEKRYNFKVAHKLFNMRNCYSLVHIRTGTGEKAYICKVCNKDFTHSVRLVRHTKIHTKKTFNFPTIDKVEDIINDISAKGLDSDVKSADVNEHTEMQDNIVETTGVTGNINNSDLPENSANRPDVPTTDTLTNINEGGNILTNVTDHDVLDLLSSQRLIDDTDPLVSLEDFDIDKCDIPKRILDSIDSLPDIIVGRDDDDGIRKDIDGGSDPLKNSDVSCDLPKNIDGGNDVTKTIEDGSDPTKNIDCNSNLSTDVDRDLSNDNNLNSPHEERDVSEDSDDSVTSMTDSSDDDDSSISADIPGCDLVNGLSIFYCLKKFIYSNSIKTKVNSNDTKATDNNTSGNDDNTKVTDTNTSVTDDNTNVIDNNTNVNDDNTKVTGINTSVTVDDTKVTDNNTSVTDDNTKVIDNNTNVNDDNTMLIDNVSVTDDNTKVTDINTNVNDDDTKVTDINTSVTDDNTKVTNNDTSVTDDNTMVIDNNTNVNDDNTMLIDNNVSVTDDNTKVTDINTNVNDNDTKVTDINTNVADDNTEVTDRNIKVTDGNTSVTDVNTKMTNNDTKVIVNDPNVTNIKNKVTDSDIKVIDDNTERTDDKTKVTSNDTKVTDKSIMKNNDTQSYLLTGSNNIVDSSHSQEHGVTVNIDPPENTSGNDSLSANITDCNCKKDITDSTVSHDIDSNDFPLNKTGNVHIEKVAGNCNLSTDTKCNDSHTTDSNLLKDNANSSPSSTSITDISDAHMIATSSSGVLVNSSL